MNFPRFNQPVPDNGYAWWYVDAISHDGRHALTVIVFIGSVFSPYYAWARRRGDTDPRNHCAVNVALYGPGGRWAMTERSSSALNAQASQLCIGPSSMRWDGNALIVDIDEWCVPLPRRLRGTIRITPAATHGKAYALDADGKHQWQPIAPACCAEVRMESPALSWQGHAYIDHNRGDMPLEASFDSWHWSRAALGGDRTAILYDVKRVDDSDLHLALCFDADGRAEAFEPPPACPLPGTGWRVTRTTRSDDGQAEVVDTLEDTPFYARSRIRSTLLSSTVESVHESLSLKRFDTGLVRLMLPFRMPRRRGPSRD